MNSFIKKAFSVLLIGCLLVLGLGVVRINAETATYQHIFTAKPSTGNNIALSEVNWNITATNLGSYNSGNYAGVQIGSSKNNGSITLTSSNSWNYNKKAKITEVRLWLNLGGTSVTPTVTIGGKPAVSDGTIVVKNSTAGSDYTKATKVTFTPATGGETGVVVINVETVKAGYICAIEIDCEEAGQDIPSLSQPTNVSVDQSSKITFSSVEHATSYTAVVKENDTQIWSGSVNNNDILPINKAGEYSVVLTASADGYLSSNSEAYNWNLANSWFDETKTVTTIKSVSSSDYYYYILDCHVSKISNYDSSNFTVSDGESELYVNRMLDSNGDHKTLSVLGIEVGDDITLSGTFYKSGSTLRFNNPKLISHTVNNTRRAEYVCKEFEALETKGNLVVSYDRGTKTQEVFEKVTETSQITAGQYLIVYEGGSVAFDGSLTTLDATDNTIAVDINNGKIVADANNKESVFNILLEENSCYIQSNSGYYIGRTAYSNGLDTSTTDQHANSITIDNDGNAVITSSGNCILRYNNASNQNRFRYFKSGQQAIQLYKLVDGEVDTYSISQEESKNQLTMQFAGIISSELKDKLNALGTTVSYGMLYAKSSNFDAETILELLNAENNPTSLNGLKDLDIFSTSLTSLHKVNSNGYEDDNPENQTHYIVGVSLNNIENENIEELITCAAYVCIDGTYYLMTEKEHSVATMAQAYVDLNASNPETYDYDNHIGFLKWLAGGAK